MARASVKTIGIAWIIIGLLLIVAGQNLYYNAIEDAAQVDPVITRQDMDIGEKMYDVGWILLVLAIIVYLAGWLLKPSIDEIIRAERFAKENHSRLQAYLEGTDKEEADIYWRD